MRRAAFSYQLSAISFPVDKIWTHENGVNYAVAVRELQLRSTIIVVFREENALAYYFGNGLLIFGWQTIK